MEWWYKSDRLSVNAQSIIQLRDKLNDTLLKGNMLRTASLFDDEEHFYIMTTNNIFLHNFLFEHGFDEIYDGEPKKDLNLIFGNYLK